MASYVLGIVVACFAAVVLHYARKVRLGRSSARWPYVMGQITDCTLDRFLRNYRGVPTPGYTLSVRYTYQVGGKHYSGNRVSFTELRIADDEDLYDYFRYHYGADEAIPVFYNPRNPALSVLRPGTSEMVSTKLGIALGATAILAYTLMRHI